VAKHRIPVDPETLPYRRCVGVMVLNREGLVWAGRRIVEKDSEISDTSQLWQMPQGGIDKGEEPLAAARRELYEETGMRSVSLIAEALGWIDYDLPRHLVGIALKGKYRGQTQKWFAFRFEGGDGEIAINPPPDGHPAEFDEWVWKKLRDFPDIVVPFKRALYEELVALFGHLAA
jgi:putative (di)nucleoside polyphosphate hydrolase